jgi:hypothetical protein
VSLGKVSAFAEFDAGAHAASDLREIRHNLFGEHVHTAAHLALIKSGLAKVAAD